MMSAKVALTIALVGEITKFDPTGHFPKLSHTAILEICGMIPIWVWQWRQHGSDGSLREYLEGVYGMPIHKSTEGSIKDNGVHLYPGDPDQHPLIEIPTRFGSFYQYEAAMIAIPEAVGHYVCRMD